MILHDQRARQNLKKHNCWQRCIKSFLYRCTGINKVGIDKVPPTTTVIQHFCWRSMLIVMVPNTAISCMLAANNTSHFVVISSPEASLEATQLPDSAHRSNGLLRAIVNSRHPPRLPGPGRAASTALSTPLPQSTTTSTLNSPGVSLWSVRLDSQEVPIRTTPRHSSGSATSSVKWKHEKATQGQEPLNWLTTWESKRPVIGELTSWVTS